MPHQQCAHLDCSKRFLSQRTRVRALERLLNLIVRSLNNLRISLHGNSQQLELKKHGLRARASQHTQREVPRQQITIARSNARRSRFSLSPHQDLIIQDSLTCMRSKKPNRCCANQVIRQARCKLLRCVKNGSVNWSPKIRQHANRTAPESSADHQRIISGSSIHQDTQRMLTR